MSPRAATLAKPVVLALALSLAAVPVWPDELRVRVAQANLREEPATTARVLSRLARGTVLQIVETAGEWFKVKTTDGRIGYVHVQVVERVAAAAATPVGSARTAPASAAGVGITHDEVGCVVAGQHPRFEACLAPDDAVARARVAFRARGTDPWYYVEMAREGACHAAILPRPQRDIEGFEYFVDVIDKNFTETLRPERAPDRAFTPRVVGRKVECEVGRVVAAALGQLTRPVVVGVLRDASGRALDAAAARALESKLLLGGFSPEGVIVSSTGAPPGAQTAGAGGSAAGGVAAGGAAGATAGGGIGAGTLAIAGGAIAAAGVVAAVAAGGDGEEALTATGRWTGTAASGGGLTTEWQSAGTSCTHTNDIVADLTETNGTLGGQIAYTPQPIRCRFPEPELQRIFEQAIAGAGSSGGTVPVSGRASGGTLSLVAASLTFNGTYTRTTLEATANFAVAGTTGGIVYRLRLTR